MEETLKSIIEKLNVLLQNLENDKGKIGFSRWTPKQGERYYYLSDCGTVNSAIWDGASVDQFRHSIGNVFSNEQSVYDYHFVLKMKQELTDFVVELNNEMVDVEDEKPKYMIGVQKHLNEYHLIQFQPKTRVTIFGQPICLDEDFLDKALDKYGDEQLIKYFKLSMKLNGQKNEGV